MAKDSWSRRQFVKGTAAAVTGAGLLGARDTSAQSSANAAVPPGRWHHDSDVVVVGFGAAGAAAAYEAARAGASVTVLDTSATGGGDTAISAGFIFMGGGTPLQIVNGHAETPEQMFPVVRAMGGEGADPDVIRTWCERGPDLYRWLTTRVGVVYDSASLSFSGMEQHALFRHLAPGGNPVPHCHYEVGATPQTGGAALFAKLSQAALGAGHVKLKGRIKATRLIQDPITRRVLGVIGKAVDAGGVIAPGAPDQFFRASRAVVIATGAFSIDREMMARHNPNLLTFNHWSQSNADGSGIRLAQQAGGDLRLMKAWWSMVFFAASPITARSILVSPQGSRFVAEDGNYYWIGYHLVAQHQTAYLIYDQAILDGLGLPPEAGYLSASTIEELADAIDQRDQVGMSRELLAATVNAYNSMANADGTSGRDPAFSKDPRFVLPLTRAPFYAVKHTAAEAQGTTGGGVRVSVRSEVLDPTGERIPGLYAAGTCSSLTMSERYTGSGTAIAGALVFGRIAGQEAAAQMPWGR